MLHGGIISWACHKQTCVALYSTEAEFVALSEACQEASLIRKLVYDFQAKLNEPICISEDHQSCLKMIETGKLSNRSKHIDTKYHFIKDYIDKGIVSCRYCPTKDMLADFLTKPLSGTRIKELRERCGLL